jgi:threonine/homoserine/homoserine lactone efflux protein
MVTAEQLLAFGVAATIIIAVPGPSVVFVVGRALAYGRGVAVLSVLGNTLGLAVVMLLVSFGLGPVVAESALVFTVLKLVGATYLVYLGVQAVRHRRGMHVPAARPLVPLRAGRALRQGFVVGFSNPKAFMMFAALLPQFVVRSQGAVTGQLLALGTLAVVVGLLCDTVWALAASQVRTWVNASPGRGRALGAVGGLSMIGLGLGVAATGPQH